MCEGAILPAGMNECTFVEQCWLSKACSMKTKARDGARLASKWESTELQAAADTASQTNNRFNSQCNEQALTVAAFPRWGL